MAIEIKDDEDSPTTVPVPKEMAAFVSGDDDIEDNESEDTNSTEPNDSRPTPPATPSALDIAGQLAAKTAELETLKASLASGPNKMAANDVSTMVQAILREVLPMAIQASAVGIEKAKQEYDMKKVEVQVRAAQAKAKRCPVCNLPETACGGAFAKDKDGKEIGEMDPRINHIKYYCGPRDEDLLDWFQGVIIRNVRFLSDYYGHLIWVPKASDIPTMINAWEQNEKALSRRRKGEGKGMRAPLGGQNVGFQGAIGWR